MNAVDEATEVLLQQGVRVLNAHLLAENESKHVEAVLGLLDPPAGAVVLDAGCGVGEVARLMNASRPDLRFILLNTSQAQLAHCPEEMHKLQGDFAAIPLPDASVDVVMFNYSLCHSLDVPAVFREARRVLREGGILFVHDLVRRAGDNRLARLLFDASFHYPENLLDWALQTGFIADDLREHDSVVARLRDIAGPMADPALEGTLPATMRFVRQTIADPVESAFARHGRIGFQFSGGRDSTAALYLLRPYWHRMTVYHLDTGDQFPETREVVERVGNDVTIQRITTDVHQIRRDHGLPSDLVPVDNTPVGQLVSGKTTRIQGRYECCWRALMSPMHERMRADGITLIVRGQRDDEYATPPKRSGDSAEGFEVLYPIQSWTGDEVSAYLRDNDLPLAPFYERGARRAPECMGCTAWWDEGRAAYMRDHHPEKFAAYETNMRIVRIEIDRQLGMLER
jgi:3'-phosphoadenosine 5'-phosphosulfate sulfotransferase (PAPS reductase)/FAD synthetase